MILDLFQGPMSVEKLADVFLVFIAVVMAITLHECGHGFAALAFGDTTAKDAGRLSLNPAKHYDPIGSTLFLVFGFGWAKPVPISLRQMSNPRLGGLVVSLAGPFTNIGIAAILALAWRGLGGAVSGYPEFLIHIAIMMNLYLAIFNLLPLPPLDGSHIITYLLPIQAANSYERFISRYGQILVIMVILVGWPLLSSVVGGAAQLMYGLLVGG
ncbi:MAG TPA: site-2 protease family protein [Armatimonadota bacterium]|jgi:Zn-dependent protease